MCLHSIEYHILLKSVSFRSEKVILGFYYSQSSPGFWMFTYIPESVDVVTKII